MYNLIETEGGVSAAEVPVLIACRAPGEGGALNKFFIRGGSARGPNPYLLYTIYDRKGTPFV